MFLCNVYNNIVFFYFISFTFINVFCFYFNIYETRDAISTSLGQTGKK